MSKKSNGSMHELYLMLALKGKDGILIRIQRFFKLFC